MIEAFTQLSSRQQEFLQAYAKSVIDASATIALTSEGDRPKFFERHVLDAVAMAESLPPLYKEGEKRVIDVGSGNGVPGVVLAILFPQWSVTCLDSDTKKIRFIDTFRESFECKNLSVVLARAEEYARESARESYDYAFARALGPLSTTLELLAGFVRVSGCAIVSRGTKITGDVSQASSLLALKLVERHSYCLGDLNFEIEIYLKKAPLDAKFPRRNGVPAKRPL